jgi:GT2 family glycosyltransferase/phosphatidylglycerophosphate synthase
MDAVAVDVLVLNYNGGALLVECLPSIVRAAAKSRHDCRVTVIDNDSTDDSLAILAEQFPAISVRRMPNRGLCSFNEALRDSTARVALLLNNDVKADEPALDPLIDALLERRVNDEEPRFASAPRCFLFDHQTHEGFQTAVRWRFGLVQATALFPGAETIADRPGLTANAGSVLAVDRVAFLELGGFDERYLPGRIEDLDLCYRAFQSGRVVAYVPQSVFFHRGGATFDAHYGRRGSERLALRNTLLFQWKNLRDRRSRITQAFWTLIRLARDVAAASYVPERDRFAYWRSWREARHIHHRAGVVAPSCDVMREREFFTRFAPQQLLDEAGGEAAERRRWATHEARRDADFPFSRWYVRPAAMAIAERIARMGVRPTQVTLVGLLLAVTAAAVLLCSPASHLVAAGLILAAWLCDRIDGPLARRQNATSAWGAWLDANIDEGVDLGLHVAAAAAAAQSSDSPWPWTFLIAFLFGKYLLMHGLASDTAHTHRSPMIEAAGANSHRSWLRTVYHLPGNADVRIHLLIAGVAFGLMTWELAIIALYYNFRWIARYVLLARRIRTASRSAQGAVA